MLIGDAHLWLTRFRDVEQRLVERIPAVWPVAIQGLPAQPLEDEITRRLVFHLRKDPQARTLGSIHSQMELLEEDRAGDVVPKGYLDMAVVLNGDAECYVAFECKRLNVAGKKGVASLAGLYVKKGMLRYLRAQYARGLPLGAMIGYVLDGDTASAEKRVHTSIRKRAKALSAPDGPVVVNSVGFVRRFTTGHNRPGEAAAFEVRHALLPYPCPSTVNVATAPPVSPQAIGLVDAVEQKKKRRKE